MGYLIIEQPAIIQKIEVNISAAELNTSDTTPVILYDNPNKKFILLHTFLNFFNTSGPAIIPIYPPTNMYIESTVFLSLSNYAGLISNGDQIYNIGTYIFNPPNGNSLFPNTSNYDLIQYTFSTQYAIISPNIATAKFTLLGYFVE